MNVREKALLMIESVNKALANGCRHYDPETGELLPDVKSILTCLATKKSVMVQQPEAGPETNVAHVASELVTAVEEAPRRSVFELDEAARTVKLGRILAAADLNDERVRVLVSFVGMAAKEDKIAIIDASATEVLVASWCRIMSALHAKASAVGGKLVLRGVSATVRKALDVAAPGVPFVFEEAAKQ